MAIGGIGASPAAGIDNVLAQLRMAQARTQASLGSSAAGAAGAVGAAAGSAAGGSAARGADALSAGGGVLRGRLSLSDDSATSAASASGAAGASPGSFVSALQASLAQVNTTQQQATKLGQDYEKGNTNVDLQDVMVAMQKANVSFQGAVQVRNRLVTAYHDIMNMQL